MSCIGTFETRKGKLTTIDRELRHVQIGKEAAVLFEIPHGFGRLPPAVGASLLGIRVASALAH